MNIHQVELKNHNIEKHISGQIKQRGQNHRAQSLIKLGFTLAEVLLTLAIIGIVASMTISPLLNSINDNELKTLWRKKYAVIAQAIEKIKLENGGTLDDVFPKGCTFNLSKVTAGATRLNSIGTFLVLKSGYYGNYDCGNLAAALSAIYNKSSSSIIKRPNGTYDVFKDISTVSSFVLQDGSFLFFNSGIGSDGFTDESTGATYGKCDYNAWGYLAKYGPWCTWVYVDVNGAKGPNMWGKDFFQINIFQTGIMPNGISLPSRNYTGGLQLAACDINNPTSCGAWILANPDFKVPW